MADVKIFAFLFVVFLTQGAFSSSVSSSDESFDIEDVRKNPTPKQKLYLYVMDNFSSLVTDYARHVYEVSEKMLKDESLIANHNVEVVEFKDLLNKFVNKYKSIKKTEAKLNIVGVYNDITEHYYGLPEAKQTVDTHFIVDILNKYNARKPALDFYSQFQAFISNLKKQFEETKPHLDKPTLEWYEKFNNIVDYKKQIGAFDSFWDLA